MSANFQGNLDLGINRGNDTFDNTQNDQSQNLLKDSKKHEQYLEKKIIEFREVSENAKKVYICMIIGIVVSFFITILGALLIAKSATTIAGILVSFGLISGFSFAWGIYATMRYAERVDHFLENDRTSNPQDIDQSMERTFLNIALYLMMMIFIVFLLLSICCFSFQNQVKNEIRGIAQNSEKWKGYFGNYSYDQVLKSATTIMSIVGVLTLALAAFIGIILAYAFHMLGSYRTWQTVIEFVCVLFFQLGLLFLYIAVYAHKYRNVAKVDKAMPTWVPDALLGIAVISILIAIFGYISAWTENTKFLNIFTAVTGIFTATIVILAVGGALYSNKFQDFFATRCSSILDQINQDYLVKYAGCNQKYISTSNYLDGIQCPKQRVVTAWEVNLGINVDKQKDVYGCLDAGCCYTTYNYIQSKMDYLALIAFSLFVLGCLLVGGSWYMLNQLDEEKEIGESETKARFALIVVVIVVVVILLIFIGLIPNPPTPQPTMAAQIDAAPSSSSQVQPRSVVQANATAVAQAENEQKTEETKSSTTVTEDNSNCAAGCLQLRYFYELSSQDGVFLPNPIKLENANINVTANQPNGTGWYVAFNGNSSNLNNFTEYYSFSHYCPLNPAKIHVKVSAVAYNPKNSTPARTSFIQLEKSSNKLKQSVNASASVNIQTNNTNNSTSTNNSTTNNNSTNNSTSNATAINNGYIIDMSKLVDGRTYVIIDKDQDFSYVSNSSRQTVSGNVFQVKNLSSANPLTGADVKITALDFSQCPVSFFTTDSNGFFNSTQFYVLNGNIPAQYKVDITYPGLVNYTHKFTVGGLGWNKQLSLGQIALWNSSMLTPTDINTNVISSLNNSPLPGVTISIYAGYKDFSNQVTQTNGQSKSASFLQIKQAGSNSTNSTTITTPSNSTSNSTGNSTNTTTNNTNTNSTTTSSPSAATNSSNILIMTNTTSGINGNFSFTNLSPNTYTIVLQKVGYYREVYYIDVIGVNTKPLVTIQMTPILTDNTIRFVLSWPNGPMDLDIHSLFKISRLSKCEVYFGKRDCLGTSLNVDNFSGGANGVETITINTLGNYIYTFAVHKYTDISGGSAPGDNPMPGSANNSTNSTNPATVPDVTLSQSLAKVTVYAPGFLGPIYQLSVPNFSPQTILSQNQTDLSSPWWVAFCLNGNDGINSLSVINKLSANKPDYTICENLYSGPVSSFLELQTKALISNSLNKMKKNRH